MVCVCVCMLEHPSVNHDLWAHSQTQVHTPKYNFFFFTLARLNVHLRRIRFIYIKKTFESGCWMKKISVHQNAITNAVPTTEKSRPEKKKKKLSVNYYYYFSIIISFKPLFYYIICLALDLLRLFFGWIPV